MAELLALVLLVAIAYGLFRIIPGLADLAAGLYQLYSDEVRKAFRRDR
jgi:exosortase/archaeosortase